MRRRLVIAVVTIACALIGAPGAFAASSDLFISEYVEGSSFNKAVEFFNNTGSAIDLASQGYNVQMYFNGSTAAALTINLTGTLVNQDAFVLAPPTPAPRSSASPTRPPARRGSTATTRSCSARGRRSSTWWARSASTQAPNGAAG